MPVQIRENHPPKAAMRLLWLTVAQLALALILYIPRVFSLPLWIGMLILAAVILIPSLNVAESGGARATARFFWILISVLRWFAIIWCVYECLFLGFDAASRADACASAAAVVCALSAVWMPTTAAAVAVGQKHTDGLIALLASIINFLVAIFLHAYEPLGIRTILRITEGAPEWIVIAVNLIALVLAGAVMVAAFLACPARPPKAPREKGEKEA